MLLAALIYCLWGSGQHRSRGHRTDRRLFLQLFWYVLFRVRTDLKFPRRHLETTTDRAGAPSVRWDTGSQNNDFGSQSWQSLCLKTPMMAVPVSSLTSQHVQKFCVSLAFTCWGPSTNIWVCKDCWAQYSPTGTEYYTSVSKLVTGKNQLFNI